MDNIDIKKLLDEIDDSYTKLSGRTLGLSEGFFKDIISQERWNLYRKLILDMINVEKKYIKAKLEGKNYYHFVPIKRKD